MLAISEFVDMRILSFLTSYWNSQEDYDAKFQGRFGIEQWYENSLRWFSPSRSMIACGTYSEPGFNRLRGVPVINSGLVFDKPYDHFYCSYSGAALTAALAAALNYWNFDLLVNLDNDCLVGAVDFDSLLREFMQRPELLLTPDWHGRPGGPFVAWKREGAARWLHQRKRANLIEPKEGEPEPLLIEDEMGEIFKGAWWNPFQPFKTLRQDFGLEFSVPEREPLEHSWPFVRLPHPNIIEEYTKTKTMLAKPAKV